MYINIYVHFQNVNTVVFELHHNLNLNVTIRKTSFVSSKFFLNRFQSFSLLDYFLILRRNTMSYKKHNSFYIHYSNYTYKSKKKLCDFKVR